MLVANHIEQRGLDNEIGQSTGGTEEIGIRRVSVSPSPGPMLAYITEKPWEKSQLRMNVVVLSSTLVQRYQPCIWSTCENWSGMFSSFCTASQSGYNIHPSQGTLTAFLIREMGC